MRTDVTIVYQHGGDLNYSHGALHIKQLTSEKLKSTIESLKFMMIDHIIVYKRSIVTNTEEFIYSEDGIVDFFKEWKVEY